MQISAKSIYFVTVISSFEGLQTVFRHFPDVTLIEPKWTPC
ncbi:Phosphoribosyltransferase-like [Phytophthora cactorum]|nr:Phosphoribosyltransferase-like [Phytophthora cactorum]